MILSDTSNAFKCLACKSLWLLQNLDSLQMRLATEIGWSIFSDHMQQRLWCLQAPSTATLTPATLNELYSSCLFCGATGMQEEEMKSHLGSRHGVIFQQEWKRHCSPHCRSDILFVHWHDHFYRCYVKVQWGWATGIHTMRPKLVKNSNLP